MEKLFGFLILVAIIVFVVSFIGFMFSIHWTLGILTLLFIFSKTI